VLVNGALWRLLLSGDMGCLPGYLSLFVSLIMLHLTFSDTDDRQILCVIPVKYVRWALVAAAFAQSGYFLCINIYPILATVSHILDDEEMIITEQRIRLKQKQLDYSLL
jgi:hypothetical protein